MSEKLLKFETKRDEHYRDILVNGVFGGRRPGFFEVIIYKEELNADEALSSASPDTSKLNVIRTIQCRLILDPVQAKSIARWLTTQVNDYEKQFGKITLPQEIGPQYGKPPSGLTV